MNVCLATFFRHPYARIKALAQQPEVIRSNILNLQEVHTYDVLWKLRTKLMGFKYVSYVPWVLGPRGGQVTFSKRPIRMLAYIPFGFHKGILISTSDGLLVVNAHLIANHDGDWSKHNRFYPIHRQQLDRLNDILQQPAYRERGIILSGDFNLAKTSDLYPYFVKTGGWQDAAEHADSPTFHAEFLPPEKSLERIDYIFTRGNIRSTDTTDVFQHKVNEMYLSDHAGIVATIK